MNYQDLIAENNANKELIKYLEAQLVDALGDGFFDGYLQCVNDSKSLSFDIYEVDEDLVIGLSEDYESTHKYKKSIVDIKASALDDLSNELAKVPYVGVNYLFLRSRAKSMRDKSNDIKKVMHEQVHK